MKNEKKIYFFLFALITLFIAWSVPKLLKGYTEVTSYSILGNAATDGSYPENKITEKDNGKKVNESIENDDRLSRIQVETTRNISLMLTGLLVLLVLTGILFINMHRHKNKINEELNRKNHEINLLNTQFKNQNKLLSKSEIELKSANETKDKFFSIIAHDLMNPNQALRGYAQLLKDDISSFSNDEIGEICESIYKSTESQHILLQNLLTWARSQTGRIEIKPTNFLLSDIFSRILHSLNPMAESKGIIIETGLNDNIFANADYEMICTVLRNLVSNSIKFSKPNNIIKISSKVEEEKIIVSVEDSGIGMDETTASNLFNAGTTTSTLGTSNETGTGLGLLICQEFVELNGGKIWVESEINKGTKFHFSLPIGNEIHS